MKRHLPSLILLAAFCAARAVAQQPPPPPMVPPAEELATVPGLSAAQQADVRKILIQRRDAHEAARDKTRTEMDALRTKERNEHERIDGQFSEQLRKLLGDEGYRNFAEWSLAHRGPHQPTMPPRRARGEGPELDVLPPSPHPAAGRAAPSGQADE
jgi:hypothetical protein